VIRVAAQGERVAMSISPEARSDLAPHGVIRAAINLGNPVLAQTGDDGAPKGVSVDLAHELARRTGLSLDLVVFDAAGKVFTALKTHAWDVAFMAIEPVRAAELEFTAPYVIIEGTYMVPSGSPLDRIEDFDQPGVRIAVAKGSAYHLYLDRTIERATLVAAETPAAAIPMFLDQKLDAIAGVRQPLLKYAAGHPGYRVLPGRFMEIRQAMAVPKGRLAGVDYLRHFIEEMKADGFVAEALAKSGQEVAVAPPA
jgi:polar amino acid transport system substrate-binding protein